jgi:pimeloyl-ACP methyl ester carboxylesterase
MDTANSRTAAVLVHGAWHGAWTYERIVPRLAAAGVFAVARDLPAHGLNARFPAGYIDRATALPTWGAEPSPVAAVTLDDYVDAALSTVDAVRALGFARVTLVGHSMGGVVLTALGERCPEKIERLVYLSAFMPARGVPAVAYIGAPENAGEQVGPLLLADPREIGALRMDHRSADAAYRDRIRQAFYGDLPADAAQAALQLLTPDVPAAPMATPIETTAERWGALPRHYIRCTQDMAIRPALQQRFIDEADAFAPGNPTVVHTLDASHSPFLSQEAALADLLVRLM